MLFPLIKSPPSEIRFWSCQISFVLPLVFPPASSFLTALLLPSPLVFPPASSFPNAPLLPSPPAISFHPRLRRRIRLPCLSLAAFLLHRQPSRPKFDLCQRQPSCPNWSTAPSGDVALRMEENVVDDPIVGRFASTSPPRPSRLHNLVLLFSTGPAGANERRRPICRLRRHAASLPFLFRLSCHLQQ